MRRNTISNTSTNVTAAYAKPQSTRWQLWCALLLIGLAFVAALAFVRHFTVDDAWIIARYARNIVLGQGYAFNPGTPSDGVTGPAWLLPMMLAQWLHCSPLAFAKAVSVLCAGGAMWVALRWTHAWQCSSNAIGMAALLMSVQANLWVWTFAGLETGAATLGVTLAIAGATWPDKLRFGPLVAAVIILPWLRPEVLPVAWFCVGVAAIRRPVLGVWLGLVGMLSFASVCAFRHVNFHHLMPLAWFAKPASSQAAIQYVILGCAVLTSCLGTGIVGWTAWREQSLLRLSAWSFLVHGAAIVFAGGDWMPGFRLWVPMLPMYSALVAVKLCNASFKFPWMRYVGLAAVACIPAADSIVQLPRVHHAAQLQKDHSAELTRWLKAHADSVALVDIGRVGYFSGLDVVDLVGLTDPHVAMTHGSYLAKRIDVAYLAKRNPNAIVLRVQTWKKQWEWNAPFQAFLSLTEWWLYREPWLQRNYTLATTITYREGYHYLVFHERDDVDAATQGHLAL